MTVANDINWNQLQQVRFSPKHIVRAAEHTGNQIKTFFKQRKLDVSARSASTSGDGPGSGAGSGGDGKGGGGGGDSGKNGDDGDDDVIYDLQQVNAFASQRKLSLPSDMLEIAKAYGLRYSALTAYATLQGMAVVGGLVKAFPFVRDRLIADPKYLFKCAAEVVIDSGCATVAEVSKRGDEFWKEFEFYLSDLLVGLVLDVCLVTFMAPVAIIGGVSKSAMANTPLKRWLSNIPSAVFEANIPGVKTYNVQNRLACLLVKFGEYSLAGTACGLVGQAAANGLMLLKRHLHGTSEDDVPVPPLVKTALVWGLFMGVSANLRYQAVFGLERLVDSTIGKSLPQVSYGATVFFRFANNVIGGINFIDMARWAGVQ